MLEIQTITKNDSPISGYIVSDPAFKTIPDPKNLDTLAILYKNSLQNAAASGAANVFFPSLSCSSQPLLFRAISQIYRTILEFDSAEHTSIQKVCIVCDDDEIRNTYMVVWNFYFAGTKNARMNDGRWD